MSDTKQLINSLDEKVTLLVSKLKQGVADLDAKRTEIEELKLDLTNQSAELDKLKIENESLKTSSVETSNENEDIKLKIDGLVKEIDKCISLIKV